MNKIKAVKRLLLIALLVLPLGLFGCSGNNGATGPAGPQGIQGPAGSGITTGEACEVCHGTGRIEDVAVVHPDPTANQNVTISNITLTTNASNQAVVNFTVGVPGLTAGDFTFILADLVPAHQYDATTKTYIENVLQPDGTMTGYSTPYFEQFARETGAAPNLVDNGDGTYTYTFTYAFGDTAASAAAGLNADEYQATDDQRLAIDFSGDTGYNAAGGFLDFSGVPATGVNATAIDSQRQFVTIETCKKCHGSLMNGAAHANHYPDTRFCVLCHSPLYGGDDATAYTGTGHFHLKGSLVTDGRFFPSLIHQIHAGIDAVDNLTTDALGNPITPKDNWTDVIFPNGFVIGGDDSRDTTDSIAIGGITQGVANCTVCHANPANQPGALVDNWKTHPTRQICGTCHTAINFADGTNHGGGKQLNDEGCTLCHPDTGAGVGYSVTVAHDPTQDANYDPTTDMNAPEFDVTVTETDVNGVDVNDPTSVYNTNGGYLKPGDVVNVKVTLTPTAGGTFTDYMTAKDAAYVAGGGLHEAAIYVYGPRSDVKPLLTNGGAYVQGLNLFAGTPAIDDATVTTDSTGFGAQFTVPADATPGTYMLRVRIGDYDYDRSNPTGGGAHAYQIESYALQTFQIGTATVQAKVDGDTCVNCHGTTVMHADDHAAPFNTDHCTSCHDRSGGYADFIGNRVHAIHSHNSTGDLKNYTNGVYTTADPPSRDWADINFPLGDIQPASLEDSGGVPSANTCVICHSSGNTSFQTNPYGVVCMGCHGDNADANAHMETNGFQF